MPKHKHKKNRLTFSERIKRSWRKFEYKHTLVTLCVIAFTILFINTALAAIVLDAFQRLGYIGAFVGGLLLVWTFTSAPAVVLLLSVADTTHLPTAIVVAACGSVLGDWMILRFFNDEIGRELKPLFTKLGIRGAIRRVQRTKARWLMAFIGAFIVMLPFPDEFGIAVMGLSRAKRWKILIVCFFLDAVGVAMLLTAGRALQ